MTGRVVVVGGGITGLAAAWELSDDPSNSVTVLEASPRFGGRIRTSPFAGRMVDEGADAFLRRVPEGVELVTELGVADRLVSPAAVGAGRAGLSDPALVSLRDRPAARGRRHFR